MPNSTGLSERLVAHRGSPFRFPENTLPSFEAAWQSKSCWMECDIQFTADFVPVVYHDDTLPRVSGVEGSILETTLAEFLELSAPFAERFGDEFADLSVCTLDQLWSHLPSWPGIQIFVEIKVHALSHFGRERVMDAVHESINAKGMAPHIAAIISKDAQAMSYSRDQLGLPIGIVLPEFDESNRQSIGLCDPDYLFVDATSMPEDPQKICPGGWKWVVYTVNEPDEAQAWFDRGIDMVETDRIELMRNHFG